MRTSRRLTVMDFPDCTDPAMYFAHLDTLRGVDTIRRMLHFPRHGASWISLWNIDPPATCNAVRLAFE